MKKPGDLDVVGRMQYAREQWLRIKRVVAFLAICVSIIVVAGLAEHYSAKPQEAIISATGTLISVGPGMVWTTVRSPIDGPKLTFALVTDVDTLQAFHWAIKTWAAEFGGKLPIKYPRIMKAEDPSTGYCGSGLVAYADLENNRVVICQFYSHNPKTVMLHEVGHLLGIPHIDGDDLMKPTAGDKELDEPSPFAVAIAKAAHPQ